VFICPSPPLPILFYSAVHPLSSLFTILPTLPWPSYKTFTAPVFSLCLSSLAPSQEHDPCHCKLHPTEVSPLNWTKSDFSFCSAFPSTIASRGNTFNVDGHFLRPATPPSHFKSSCTIVFPSILALTLYEIICSTSLFAVAVPRNLLGVILPHR
jgi:hypothetical protein